MLVATIGRTVARHVTAGQTEKLPGAVDAALALAGAREPQPYA
jgi:hypothetical protein